MSFFSTISKIDLTCNSTWENRLFLTLDIDWANDDVINHSIDIIEKHDASATWFVTHQTPVLERIRNNKKFELGIHPNFNFLLNGDARNGRNASEVIDRLMTIVPEARSVRSHFMTQSSYLMNLFKSKGLTHECNHFVPEQALIKLKPWLHWNEMIKIPYFWEDDVACQSKANSRMCKLKNRAGLKVFDFHPIHIFLNTECMSRYDRCRDFLSDSKLLSQNINHGVGSRTSLIELLEHTA